MLKVVTIVHRKPGMPVGEFQDYWRNAHPPPVKALPGLRRYVQSHALPQGYWRRELAHDGIAETWFDDGAALKALQGSPEYAAVQADEANFIDRSRMVVLLVDEHLVKNTPVGPSPIKSIEFIRRRPDLGVDAFQRHWRQVHGPIASEIATLRRYVQNHVRTSAYRDGRTPFYDGLAVAWFDSTADMRASAASPAYAATRRDEPNFLADGEFPVVLTREHVIVG